MTIGSLSDSKVASDKADQPTQLQRRLGVAVRPLTPEEKQRCISHGSSVQQSGGAAESAGIQPGDVILAVNGRPVASVDQLKQMVAGAGT